MLYFDYGIIEIWKKTPQDLLELNHPELLPFLPLTEGGTRREVIELMFAKLEGDRELETIGYLFAALAFRKAGRQDGLEWLEKRFSRMHDILRESPAYHWILNEGIEEGKAQAEQERQQTLVQTQQVVLQVIADLFPTLSPLAEGLVKTITDLVTLTRLVASLTQAQGLEQAMQIINQAVQADRERRDTSLKNQRKSYNRRNGQRKRRRARRLP